MMRTAKTGGASVAAIVTALLWSGSATAQAPAGASATAQSAPAEPVEAGADTQEVVVTGSRLGASGFTAPTPVTVVGEQEIARQAAPNVSEVLNQVPAFRAQSTPSTTAIFVSNLGAANADLRGLGANRTLVLIDGRRVVASTVQGGSFTPANTVDLNLIPTALIQRSEVVTGGASAAYGSDAVAGVVNLILNKDLEGVRGNVQYGQTKYGDNEEWLLSLAAGTRFAGGRGRLVGAVEYVDNKGTGDCYSRPWCRQSFNTISNPLLPGSTTRSAAGLPATLILPNARTATATRAGIINSGPLRGTEFGPTGQTFRHDYGTFLGTPPAFANGGIFQSGGGDPQLAFYENFPIAAPVERINTFVHADFEVDPGFSLFAEGSYGHVQGTITGAQRRDLGNITIRGENPFLQTRYPTVAAGLGAAGTANFGKIYNDLGPQIGDVERETYRLVGGFEKTLGSRFTLDGYYQYGRTNYTQLGFNTSITPRINFALDAVRNAAGQIVCAGTVAGGPRFNPAAAGCVPYDVFGVGNFSPEAKAYVTGTARQDTALSQHVAALTVRGDLFELWAGPLSVAAGGEYRRDRASGTTDPFSAANQFYTSPGAAIDGRITVKEVFLEAGLPLARETAFARTLELNGAVRYTDYSTTGGETTWKLGAVWEPVEWLRFRGTRSRDIRAPNIFELFGPRQSSFQTVIDPLNGGAQSLPQVFLVGNANLNAERADTWTGGVVLQPGRVFGGRLRFSADWFDIKLDGAVSTLGAQIIVNRCATGALPDCANLVNRGGTANGAIQFVNNANLNLNQLITRGVDFEGSYSLPLSNVAARLPEGNVTWRVLATYVKDLITVDSAGVAIDRAGQNGSGVSQPSGLPRWTLSSYFTVDVKPVSFQVQMRYISGGRYDRTRVGPDEAGYNPALNNSINDNSVGRWFYTNLNAQYALIDDGKRRLELYGAVNNLFDRDPPVDAPSSFGPTNNVLYDVLGRTWRVGARFAF